MRITTYKATIDKEYRNAVLVKEKSSNYSSLDSLDTPSKIVEVMNNMFSLNIMAEEFCYMICVDTKNHPIGFFEISHGTVNASLISVRSIFSRAMLLGATNIILVHNHPSGEISPSVEDVNVTTRIYTAGQLMDLHLLDHIIIGGNSYYSFRENKLVIE